MCCTLKTLKSNCVWELAEVNSRMATLIQLILVAAQLQNSGGRAKYKFSQMAIQSLALQLQDK